MINSILKRLDGIDLATCDGIRAMAAVTNAIEATTGKSRSEAWQLVDGYLERTKVEAWKAIRADLGLDLSSGRTHG